MFTDFERHCTVRLWTVETYRTKYQREIDFCMIYQHLVDVSRRRMCECSCASASDPAGYISTGAKKRICVWIFSPLHLVSPLINVFLQQIERSLCIVLLIPCFPKNVCWPNCIFLRSNHALMGAFEQFVIESVMYVTFKSRACKVLVQVNYQTFFWSVIQKI